MTLKPPLVTINSVPVPANIEWAFIPGPASPLMELVVPTASVPEIKKGLIQLASGGLEHAKKITAPGGGNFTGINIRAKYHTNDVKMDYNINNLILLEDREASALMTKLLVVDCRYFLARTNMRGFFNITRKQNSYAVTKFAHQGIDANDLEARHFLDKFRDRFRLPVYAYVPQTLNSSTSQPWTALELLEALLRKYLGNDLYGGRVFSGGENWTTASLDNQRYTNAPVIQVIDDMLKLSRSNCAVFPDGKLYIYPLEEDDILAKFDEWGTPMESYAVIGEKITLTDRSGYRSSQYATEWTVEQEVPLLYSWKKDQGVKKTAQDLSTKGTLKEGNDSSERLEKGLSNAIGKGGDSLATHFDSASIFTSSPDSSLRYATLGLINVLKLNVDITLSGIRYEADTWIPVKEVTDYYGIDPKYFMHHWYERYWKALFGYHYIIKTYPSAAKQKWGTLRTVNGDPVFNSLVNSIQTHFWKTFMIDPALRDRIEKIEFTRTAMAQYQSGTKLQQLCWLNYFDMGSIKQLALSGGKKKKWDVNFDVNSEYKDMDFIDIAKTSPSPFPPKLIDHDAGVFTVDFSNDQRGLSQKMSPGSVLPKHKEWLKDKPTSVAKNITQLQKDDWFKFMTMANVKFIKPTGNNISSEGLYTIKQRGTLPGKFPVKEIGLTNTTAKFPWRSSYEAFSDIIDNKPVNYQELEAYTASAVNIEEFENRDWYLGRQVFNYVDEKVVPFGNASIIVRFNETASTIIKFTIPTAPSLFQSMDEESRKLYFGQQLV